MHSFSDRNKIIKMILIMAGILLLVGFLTQVNKKNSLSLSDYAAQHPELSQPRETQQADEDNPADTESEIPSQENPSQEQNTAAEADRHPSPESSSLTGALLNGDTMIAQREIYTEGFYCEPLSDRMKQYITGISYFNSDSSENTVETAPSAKEDSQKEMSMDDEISLEDLFYVHLYYCDMEGNPQPGELICNRNIAKAVTEIFYELYRNEYRLGKVCLIEEYNGNVNAALEAGSCFSLAVWNESENTLPGLAEGLCMVINPVYNPIIVYNGTEASVTPENGLAYADRSQNFSYKINEDDLCYRLFTSYGFLWGGNRNDGPSYCTFRYRDTHISG